MNSRQSSLSPKRTLRGMEQKSISSMILFTSDFPPSEEPPSDPSKPSRPGIEKSAKHVHKRRSIRLSMKGMRLDSFLQKSLERIDLQDCSGEMALVDGKNNLEPLVRSSSRRLQRHELMSCSGRSSSNSSLKPIHTSRRSQRLLLRKNKKAVPDESSIVVDGNIQDKCAKHAIVF